MKTLALICFGAGCALLALGCSSSSGGIANAGTGGTGPGSGGQTTGGSGTGGSGAGGTATGGSGAGGGGGAATGGTGGSSCPGAQPLTGSQCRSQADCPKNGSFYYCSTDPGSITSACATPFCATSPVHECTVDSDCPTGDICDTVPIRCCTATSTVCHVSCKAPGVTCAAGTTCSPGTTGADAYGCVPVLCNAGYTCSSGFSCSVGSAAADPHGCLALPCTQTGCPANFVCKMIATFQDCAPKPCTTDCDCDSGYCVGGYCSSVLGTCVSPPA